ncbi:MAG: glycosyltransferase family 39 protein [Acidobacteriia bacterium]|nr:glycosyltransferase family 39 protein [Terriglobia bacterium]
MFIRVHPWLKGFFAVGAALTIWSALAVWYFYSHGWLLYYGDAEAHLNIARRILDSKTAGYDQIGTVWLPLPHALMMPFVRVDALWRSGVGGAIPSAACFVLAGCFLFAAARRIFQSTAAGCVAAALFALDPNMMYLQSTAMTEAIFAAAVAGLLYFTVRFRETQGWGAVIGAGLATCAGTLTRYDGWFLLPFAAAYFLWAAKRRRVATALVFCVVAGAGPLYWLANNWWLAGDALDFYHGPFSAQAIQAGKPYPGKGDWAMAWLYYRTAVRLCAGPVLALLAIAGIVAALLRRAFWPVLLLALPPAFYVWSLHSSGTPIFVPELWPHSYYNTRYGLAALPLLALAGAALAVAPWPAIVRRWAPLAVVAAAGSWWLVHPDHAHWITWAESRANSEQRRAWTQEAAEYLRPRYLPGSGLLTSSGDDFFGIYRVMGIPLRETFSICNGLPWQAALARPDLWLWHEWAVVKGGDAAQQGIERAAHYGIRYRLELRIAKKDEPVVEIYRRVGGPHGPGGL